MKSKIAGKNISVVEVLNISKHGFWLFIRGKEYFLSFRDYPWFKEAKIDSILKVELPQRNHLYWPDLDVDLEVDSLKNPDHYPLTAKTI